MDVSQWTEKGNDEGKVLPTDNLSMLNMFDANNHLNWVSAPGWSHDYEPSKGYVANWGFDLTRDFQVDVGFNLDHTVNWEKEQAGVLLGFNSPGQDKSMEFGAFTNAYLDNGVLTSVKCYEYESSPNTWTKWERFSNDGILRASYVAMGICFLFRR
jgi:hypothetical protein